MNYRKNILPYVFFSVLLVYACAAFPFLLHAQYAGLGDEQARIEIDPLYPLPNTPFSARLADYSGTLGTGELRWYINGELKKEYAGQASIALTAPGIGIPLAIKAERDDGYENRSVSLNVVPSELDIIIESNSSAPYFYKGRRVPVIGAGARIVIIPHIYTEKGVPIAPQNLMYSWNVNNQNVPSTGQGILETTISPFGDSLVAVSVESKDHLTKYETTFFIESAKPLLAFYTYNPLSGLSQNAIQDAYVSAKDELSVRAQPYFLPSDVLSHAQYGWSINGTPIQNNNTDPNLLTVQKAGEGGTSDISFSLRNLSVLSQYVQGVFRVNLQ